MNDDSTLFGKDAFVASSSRPGANRSQPARLRVPDRMQAILDPACIDERLPGDHEVRTVWAVVERMDLSAISDQIEARGSSPGRAATDPRLLVALMLFAAIEGIGSCREIAERCERDLPYQWLCGGVSLNHHTLSDFRVGYEKELDDLLTRMIATLVHQGLVQVQRISQDGVRVRASAGRSSFRRGETLAKLAVEARRHVEDLKKQADDPALPARQKAARERAANDRLVRIERALELLPAAQATKARHTGKPSKDQPPRVSTTDPEAHRMKVGTGAILPAYNIQLASDPVSRAVVGVIVGNHGADGQFSVPMRQQVEQKSKGKITEHLIDGGYFNKNALEQAHENGVVVYMPLPQATEGQSDPAEKKPGDGPGTVAWRARMTQEAAKLIYKKRASTSETINADLTTHRALGRLMVRGITKVKCIVLWNVLAYNLMHFGTSLLS